MCTAPASKVVRCHACEHQARDVQLCTTVSAELPHLHQEDLERVDGGSAVVCGGGLDVQHSVAGRSHALHAQAETLR